MVGGAYLRVSLTSPLIRGKWATSSPVGTRPPSTRSISSKMSCCIMGCLARRYVLHDSVKEVCRGAERRTFDDLLEISNMIYTNSSAWCKLKVWGIIHDIIKQYHKNVLFFWNMMHMWYWFIPWYFARENRSKQGHSSVSLLNGWAILNESVELMIQWLTR